MLKYPFTPELLDAIPEELSELMRGLELTLLDEICQRLKASGQLNEVTVQDIRALRAQGIDLQEIKAAIAETTEIGYEKLNELLDDVVERNQKYYTEVIDIAQITKPDRLVNKRDIVAIRRQTLSAYRNITGSMGFVKVENGRLTMMSPAKAYQSTLDMALGQIDTGAISYNQAITNAIRELAKDGMCVVFDKNGKPVKNMVGYESGHKDQLDVAVRRAVMTGVNQINQKYREMSMEYLQTDLVETTAHLGARNIGIGFANHESWQGGIYRWAQYTAMYPGSSKGNYKDFDKTCGVGDVQGIGGANCRHSFYAFVEGVMEPTYTAERLEAMKAENHTFEFEGKKYNGYTATQKQREIERTVRKKKREFAGYDAAGRTMEATAAKSYIRALMKEYREFSKVAGLPTQPERMRVLYAA